MGCLGDETIARYLDGALGASSDLAAELHLDSCRDCRRLVAAWARSESSGEPRDARRRMRSLLVPGERVLRFEVVRLLARGGMSQIYLARDIKLGRRVALKLIDRKHVGGRPGAELLLHEAQTIATLSHPNIVTVYDVGEHDGHVFVALEHIDGDSLRDRMRADPPSMREALRIMAPVFRALEAAHSQGILHRDVKPANIVLGADGRPRLVDFGLALGSGSPAEDGGGTPRYMAPEQWAQASPSEKIDLWSAGVVLFELFAGRHPHAAASTSIEELGAAVRSTDADPLAGDLPPDLRDLVARCLSRDPSARPTAAECAEVLEAHAHPRRAPTDRAPFLGLAPFHEPDAAVFFGREREIAEILERLRREPLLGVVGPSGAGKSSLVRAGVMPRINERGDWIALAFRPGADPFTAVCTELELRFAGRWQAPEEKGALGDAIERAAVAAGKNVLLVIDQLEEIHALVPDEEVRAWFLDFVASAAEGLMPHLRTIFTLREDFLPQIAAHRAATPLLKNLFPLSSRLDRAALQEILSGPLAQSRFRFEDGLVDRMLAEIDGEPSPLPLIAFAAERLWYARDQERRTLTIEAYLALGGVAGALASHADGVVEGLTPSDVRITRELLLQMITPERTRRARRRRDLIELDANAEPILDRMIALRLLSVRTGADSEDVEIELAHESLIDRWPRLSRWFDRSREDLVLLEEIAQAAELWKRRGARPEELWTDDALADAQRRIGNLRLPQNAAQFLAASVGRARRRRLLRRGVAGVVVVVALLVMTVLERGRRTAERESRRALANQAEALRENARAAFIGGAPLEARAQLLRSLELDDSRSSRVLWWRLSQEPLWWSAHLDGVVRSIAISEDVLAAGTSRGVVHLFDVTTGRELERRRAPDQVWSLAITGGRSIAVGTRSGRVVVWPGEFGATYDPSQIVTDLCRAQEKLVVARSTGPVEIRDPATMTLIRTLDARSSVLACEGDDVYVVSSGELRLHRELAPSGSPIASVEGDVLRLVADPESDGVALARSDGSIERIDARSRRRVAAHTGRVGGIAFAPGSRIVSGGNDRSVRVFDADRLTELARADTLDPVVSVAVDPARDRIAAATLHDLHVWRLSRFGVRRLEHGHSRPILQVAFGGELVASSSLDGTIRLWRAETQEELGVLRGHAGGVYGFDFLDGARRIVSGGTDGTIRIFDVERRSEERVLRGHRDTIGSVVVHQGRKLIASSGRDATIRLWSAETWTELERVTLDSASIALDFDAEGARLVSAHLDGSVRIFALPDLAEIAVLRGHRGFASHAVFATEREVLSAGEDGTLRRWRLDTETSSIVRRESGRLFWVTPIDGAIGWAGSDGLARRTTRAGATISFEGNRGDVGVIAIDPSERFAVTGGDDGTVRFFDAQSGRALGRSPVGRQPGPIEVELATGRARGYDTGRIEILGPGGAVDLIGTPGSAVSLLGRGPGETVIAGYQDGFFGLWDLETGHLIAHADLHGPVVSHRVEGAVVEGESELGSRVRWKLEPLDADYCELVHDIRREVPIRWIRGRAERVDPPHDHPCAK